MSGRDDDRADCLGVMADADLATLSAGKPAVRAEAFTDDAVDLDHVRGVTDGKLGGRAVGERSSRRSAGGSWLRLRFDGER